MSAPTNWLLLRGLMRERRHWAGFAEELAARSGTRVLALDLPGVGTDRDRRSPASVPAIVDDLRGRFLAARAQHSDGPWSVFAPSLGGMIALCWAERHPEDFVRVVVCNTSTKDLGSTFERFSPLALRTVLVSLAASVVAPDAVARERRTLALVSNTAHGRAHAEQFARFSNDAPVGRRVLVRQLWAASRTTAPRSLSVSVIVMCSDGDRLCSSTISRALAARLDAPLRVHPTGGHDLPLDDPDWVIEQLLGS